jgi:adenine-specific DNA-methyltransferase
MIQKTPIHEVFKHYDTVLNFDATKRTQNDICTPIACIQEMMKQVPERFWERDDLSILDPCCGNGNFHAVIYDVLETKGHTHDRIMKMLHFNDVNEERLANVRTVFGGGAQITQLDYMDFAATYEQRKYDLIVANPPYARLMPDGKRASKNHNMIGDFIKTSFSLLKPGGYFVAITPDNWMSYADRNDLAELLTTRNLIYLNIHTAKRHFPKVGSSFTWYVVQNSASTDTMTVEGVWKKKAYKDTVPKTQPLKFIPLLYSREVQSILRKTLLLGLEHPKFQIETTSDLHKYTKRALIRDTEDPEHRYRLIHTPKQTVWSSRAHKYQMGTKVFISLTDKYAVFIDRDCGMTQSIAFIRCNHDTDAEIIKGILEHPLYVFLNNICRWGNFNNVRILQSFPIPRDPADIYGSFGITLSEQDFIEENL